VSEGAVFTGFVTLPSHPAGLLGLNASADATRSN
jgi:hypothetical protein